MATLQASDIPEGYDLTAPGRALNGQGRDNREGILTALFNLGIWLDNMNYNLQALPSDQALPAMYAESGALSAAAQAVNYALDSLWEAKARDALTGLQQPLQECRRTLDRARREPTAEQAMGILGQARNLTALIREFITQVDAGIPQHDLYERELLWRTP